MQVTYEAVATVDEVRVELTIIRDHLFIYVYHLSRCFRRLHEGFDLLQILLAVCFYTTADIDTHNLLCLIAQTLKSFSDIVRVQTSGKEHVQAIILPENVNNSAQVQLLSCAACA